MGYLKKSLYLIFCLLLTGCFSPSTLLENENKNDNQAGDLTPITPEEEEKIVTKIYEQKQHLDFCNQEIDQALSANSINIYPLDQERYLVEFLCFLGAYQGNYQYAIGQKNTDKLTNISFLTFSFQTEELQLVNTDTLVGTIDFDQQTQRLTVFTKNRGLGDCGSYAIYQWQDSASFELKEYRDKSNCDGVYLDPENYPQIYP